MNNLNQTQKEFLETVSNVEQFKTLKKAFEKVNNEIAGLTDEQIYFLNNTVYTDCARKKLIKLFRIENLMINIDPSIN
jgi:methanogenic corrinoid protein MtbC1